MSTAKRIADPGEVSGKRSSFQCKDAKHATPGKQQDLISLEIDENDFGGDPYNRTGQFCLIELKNKGK